MLIRNDKVDIKDLYKSLAIELYEKFVINKKYFAEQLSNGKYSTKNNFFDPLRINDMLINQKSYLTYQQIKTKLKWICLDFDIDKKILETDFPKDQQKYINILINEVRAICKFLDSYKIDYLAEFSGNRGIHIWVLFTEPVEKLHAFQFVQRLVEKIKNNPSSYINVDLFPKSGQNNNNKVGFGVKLPLSLHTKSQNYSYFIDDIYSFVYSSEIWKNKLDEEFLSSQLNLLSRYQKQSFKDVALKLNLELEDQAITTQTNPFIPTKNALKETNENLDDVLNKIKQCTIIDEILKKYPNELNESERIIFVGLLNKLRTPQNDNYGKELLWDFFSKMDNFKPELTRKKLENLNLHPPTCGFLRSKFSQHNCNCEGDCSLQNKEILELKTTSPLKFLDVDLLPYDAFEVKKSEIDKIIKAQRKYTDQNDEIAFLFTQLELENIDVKDMKEAIENILGGNYTVREPYKFSRLEKNSKVRCLYTLQAEEKVISTYLIKILNAYYYTEFSDDSYGYKFENSFANYNIFKPWMQQWLIYRNKIMERLNDDLLAEHYIIKLDIKNFYSSLNLGRLKTKLIHGPSEIIKDKINSFSNEQLSEYNHLIDYLIKLCEKDNSNAKGVPQGPAFARYLAEVYLIELDKYIQSLLEENFNFYFRYVDDMVLILENEEKAKEILDKIQAYLESLDLHINWDKYLLSKVKNSKSDFESYFNDNKYFIDNSSKNQEINSSFINKKATRMLSKIVKPTIVEVNEENLSFYFTHFNNNKRLLEEKRNFESYLFNLEIGRGSLFRNYFRYYFSKNNNFNSFVESSKVLKGLGKGVFLNTLFESIYYQNYTDKEKTKHVIYELIKPEVNNYETELILSLMLLENEFVHNEFILKVHEQTLLKVLRFKFEKVIPKFLEERVLNTLEKERDIQEFILNAYDLIFYNSLSSDFIIKISEMFFNKIIQSMGTADPKDFVSYFLDSRRTINKYYHLCCLLTLTEQNFSNIKRVWENLITYVNTYFPTIVLDYNKWLRRTSTLKFKPLTKNNLNTILTIKIHDNFLEGNSNIDKLKLYDHFHTGIVLFLMEAKDDSESISDYLNQESINVLENIQKKYNLEFINWIINEKEVSMYPEKKIGQRNVIENDRIVLQRGNQLLVRVSRKEVVDFEFDYLTDVQIKDEKWLDGEYLSIIFRFNRNDYISMSHLLNSQKDFHSYIDKVISVFESMGAFKKQFIKNQEKFPSILGNYDLIHKETYFPLIPFSSYDKKLVLSDNEVIENNTKNFHSTFFNKINTNIELFRGKPYTIKTSEINKNFFPKKIQGDAELKILYMKRFLNIFNKNQIDDAFYFELCKFKTIVSLIDTIIKTIGEDKREFYFYLEYYHSLYKEDSDLIKLLLTPVDIKTDSIFHVFETIKNSMFSSVNCYDFTFLKEIWEKEIRFLVHLITTLIPTEENTQILDVFKKCSFEYDDFLNEIKINTKNDTWIIPEEDWSSIKIYQLQQKNSLIRKFELSDVNVIENTEYCFAYQAKDSYLILIMPDIIGKTLDSINNRKKLYKKYESENDLINLDCFNNNIQIEEGIVYSPHFAPAVKIIKEQSFYKERKLEEIEADLLTWVRRFDKKYHQALLNVIASHQYIKEEDIEEFMVKVDDTLGSTNKIFFHIKSAEDYNGFHRLVLSGFPHTRKLKLDQFVSRVLTESTSDSDLVILSEIGISGSQIVNALKRYYLSSNFSNYTAQQLIDKEKYYPLQLSQHTIFKEKMKSFKNIFLFFIGYTEKSRGFLQKEICELLDYPVEKIFFYPEEHTINFKESILLSNPNIDSRNQELFEELIRNTEYIGDLFNFSGEQKKQYIKYLRDLDKVRNKYDSDYNLILRKGSTPKKSHQIFTLESDVIRPLFEKTKEHTEN
ncbi:TOTE conflict system archaeo-eukaryotic primase domain-containing protein [Bacillus toyonensis]